MTYPETEIDKISVELHELAQAYAERVEALASDPYFREALVKVSVSGFVWALHNAFDERSRDVLFGELTEQTAAIGRSIGRQEEKLN
jgi:hypothetical protein